MNETVSFGLLVIFLELLIYASAKFVRCLVRQKRKKRNTSLGETIGFAFFFTKARSESALQNLSLICSFGCPRPCIGNGARHATWTHDHNSRSETIIGEATRSARQVRESIGSCITEEIESGRPPNSWVRSVGRMVSVKRKSEGIPTTIRCYNSKGRWSVRSRKKLRRIGHKLLTIRRCGILLKKNLQSNLHESISSFHRVHWLSVLFTK